MNTPPPFDELISILLKISQLLYSLIKLPARIALLFYCRHCAVNNRDVLKSKGPLLIAANHPNSFLDAIIIATLFNQPVYSLARGDVFANDFYTRLLLSLKILPVYRISEGAENLGTNYKTFDQCKEIFKKDGIVLIFSEGMCINEWHLRPLKKGTARLAISCWEDGIPLQVLPTGINYNSFRKFGKNLRINFGETIGPMFNEEDSAEINYGNKINTFNSKLRSSLEKLVFEIDKKDKAARIRKFTVPISSLKKILLFLPAALGWLSHAPIYYGLKQLTALRTRHNDHYDSVLVGLLVFLCPLYLAIACTLIYSLAGGWWALAALVVLPFCGWSFVQLKKQFED